MNLASARAQARNKLPFAIQLLHSRSKATANSRSRKFRQQSKNKALRVLDIISPQTPSTATPRQTHLRLLQDLLNSHNVSDHCLTSSRVSSSSSDLLDEILETSSSNDEESNTVGYVFDATSLSAVVSFCASSRDIRGGIQYHGLAITAGFISNAYVGSALITLYGKCGELDNACKVFHEMPVRNVVTWTAIISGFAQEWKIDICLELFSVMRKTTLKPNDYTFTSLLCACTGTGAIGQGTSAHCQIIQLGFHFYLHVANALISMYCKCGDVHGAFYVFENIFSKDIVSWNSMITGYAQHGLAIQAIELFENMKSLGVKPDSITFIGVLSACRHAGFVEKGRNYFDSMVENGLRPQLDHYSCLVDLLGRAGLIEEAQGIISRMPLSPNAVIWGSLLSSCRLHGSVWTGIQAAEQKLLLEPSCSATHVLLANLYASVRYWDQTARVRKLMKDAGLKTNTGYSCIEIKNKIYRFRAEDRSNERVAEIVIVLDCLVDHMMTSGYVPEIDKEEANDVLI